MSTTESQTADCEFSLSAPPEVESQVWGLLGSLYPRGNLVEKRRERRFPYPYLIRLIPLGDDGITPEGEPLVVVGKHLSEGGLGFYHPEPIVQRHVMAVLETPGGARMAFVTRLTWCRFARQGWYESGGRFLKSIAPPACDG